MSISGSQPTEYALQQLADECQQQNQAFKRAGRSDTAACLQLFRHALEDKMEAAWNFIYACYSGYLTTIVRRYRQPGWCDEDAEDLVQQTLLKFSQSASYKPHLPMIISYLKQCAQSVVIDCHRRTRLRPLSLDEFEEEGVYIAPTEEDITDGVHDIIEQDQMWGIIMELTNSNIEKIVVFYSLHQGLKPRYIAKIFPDLFDSPAQVSRIRDNFMKRLKKQKNILEPFWRAS